MSGMFGFWSPEVNVFNQNLSSWIVNPKVTSCSGYSVNATSWTLPKPAFANCTP
jgi:hypothetical protein